MDIKFSDSTASLILAAIRDQIDGGSGAGTIKFYTGTKPSSPDVAITSQVLLGTLTCSDPCAPAPSAKSLTFNSISQDSSADATGTATWARIAKSDGTAVVDVDVTNSSGNGFIKMNSTSIIMGGPIIISSFVITVP